MGAGAWLVYGVALVMVAAFAVVAARLPRAANGFNPGVLAGLASLGAGLIVVALTTPGGSPISRVPAYLPFVLVAVFGFVSARRLVIREREQG